MKKIDIDPEVYEKLKELADPFVERSPNDVLRRILGLPGAGSPVGDVPSGPPEKASFREAAWNGLRPRATHVHPGFLAFLIDKHKAAGGGFRTADIIPFMDRFNLVTVSGHYRNPWMDRPYGGQKWGKSSCEGSIEQYRQCRHYGCWGGRDSKEGCDDLACRYHPRNPCPETCVGRNKCDLRKGVIWKRQSPLAPYTFGKDYVEIVRSEFLKGGTMPLGLLAGAFYPGEEKDERALSQFGEEFHIDEPERALFRP